MVTQHRESTFLIQTDLLTDKTNDTKKTAIDGLISPVLDWDFAATDQAWLEYRPVSYLWHPPKIPKQSSYIAPL